MEMFILSLVIIVCLLVAADGRPPPRNLAPQLLHDHARAPRGRDATGLHAREIMGRRHLQGETHELDDKLRFDLLQNYDRGSYPWEFAWNNSNSTSLREGVPVEVGINFHRVFAVDIINSVADLTVWFRQRWVDPRLRWNPADYNDTQTTWFWISDGIGSGEVSEIWTPDIELWNMAESLKDTLTDALAVVNSDGTVFWSRPGRVKPACKFKGLDSFPFDHLSCTMEFGSWSYSGLYIRPTKMGGTGFTIGGSETAGEAFAEYQLSDDNPVDCRQEIYPPFPGAPEEDWPVLLYDVKFHRSWEPYARGYIVTQVILNLAGFATFWLPVQSGERISLAITAMLAAVASELVVAASLPTSSEITWFQTFSLFSLSFAAIALFESVAVIFFYYYTGSDLVPSWWKWLESHCRKWRGHVHKHRDVATEQGTDKEETSARRDGDDVVHENNDLPENGVAMGVAAEGPESSWEHRVKFQESHEAAPFTANTSNGQLNDDDDDDERPQHEQKQKRRPSIILQRKDADDFVDNLEADNNVRWKLVSSRIDQISRMIIVPTYVIVVAVLLQSTERR